MRYLLLMLFVMSGFVGHVFGSEKESAITSFKVSGFILENNHPLYYRDSKYIDGFKKKCGVECPDNECFVQVSYSSLVFQEQDGLQDEYSKSIAFIPLRYFYNKQKGSEVLSFSTTSGNEEKKIQLILDVDIDKKNFEGWITSFSNKPQWTSEDNVQELCKKNIMQKHIAQHPFAQHPLSFVEQLDIHFESFIQKSDMQPEDKMSYTYVHGSKGFFAETLKKRAEELKNSQEEELKQKAKLWASRLKKLFGCSIAAILVYILCQKFYATAG